MATSRTKKDALWRLFAALIPAFIFTNSLGMMLILLLPGDKVVNLSYVITFAFLFYSVLVMWVFHTPHKRKVFKYLGLGIAITSFGVFSVYQWMGPV